MRKLLLTASGIIAVVSLATIPAVDALAQSDTPGSGWLSIGIPEQAQNEAEKGFIETAPTDGSLLGATSEVNRFTVRGGRINPSLGLTWDRNTGHYGMTMSDDPEPSDIFSFATGFKFDPPGWGSHSLSGRTLLIERSKGLDGLKLRNDDGLPRPLGDDENRGSPSSFNLVLEGGGMPILPELTYHLAMINPSSAGESEFGSGFAAGLTTRFNFGRGLSISPTIEAARLSDPASATDRQRQYWSTSMLTEWRNWNLGLTYTQGEAGAEADTAGARQTEASIGYVFDFGLTAGVGWHHLEKQDDTTDQFGIRFTYPFRPGK